MEETSSLARRLLANAQSQLAEIPVEHGRYTDVKRSSQACGAAYLAALKVIDTYLLSRGRPVSELPDSRDDYWEALRRVPHNGKLRAALNTTYENLHVLGYYRGGASVKMIKDGLSAVRVLYTNLLPKVTPRASR